MSSSSESFQSTEEVLENVEKFIDAMENPDPNIYTPTPLNIVLPHPWMQPPVATEGDSSGEKEREAARALQRMQNLAAQDASIEDIDKDLNLTEEEIQAKQRQELSQEKGGSSAQEPSKEAEPDFHKVPFQDEQQDVDMAENLPPEQQKDDNQEKDQEDGSQRGTGSLLGEEEATRITGKKRKGKELVQEIKTYTRAKRATRFSAQETHIPASIETRHEGEPLPRVRSKRAMNDPTLVRDLAKAKGREEVLPKGANRGNDSREVEEPSRVKPSRALITTGPKDLVSCVKPKPNKFRTNKARGKFEELLLRAFIEEVQVEGSRFK